MKRHIICLLILALAWGGCATTDGPRLPTDHPLAVQPDERVRFPPYQGPKQSIQVVQIRIPKSELDKWPELADRRVGYGFEQPARRSPV